MPHDRVGMVIAQPFLTMTAQEPFRTVAASKAQLLADLSATMAVARLARHGAAKTHFTIFPEYSVPGLDGIAIIDGAMAEEQWPTGTVVIGGVDALSKVDFETLAAREGSHVDSEHNSVDKIDPAEWVNCAIIWTKAADGTVERWLQPKLWPAWDEQNITYQNMYRGKSIFSFKGVLSNGQKYRFSTLICFDWIAAIDNKRAWRWALDDLDVQATEAEAEISLSWMFVIQRNPKPSHASFLGEVASFFDANTLPNVRRDRACLVFANCAGKQSPGRAPSYGGGSVIFTKNTQFKEESSRPTVARGGERFRSNALLNGYRDTYFRETGACVHSFVQINPDTVNGGPGQRSFAVDKPFVFPLAQINDPRTPSNLVPACVKWVNDELDELPSLSSIQPEPDLGLDADAVHEKSISSLRALSAKSTSKVIRLATVRDSETAGAPRSQEDADLWDRQESDALKHVVHTLDLFALTGDVSSSDEDIAHAKISLGGKSIDLVAIRGRTHEQCSKHAQSHFTPDSRRQALLVTRDNDNVPLKRRSRSILQTEQPQLGEKRRFTDPESGVIHIDYQGLIAAFRNASNASDLAEGIKAHVAI